MKPTIKNKLVGGYALLIVLMGIIAVIGIYSVFGLRKSALETARVGDRLDSISLEIQVHNLEAQRKTQNYLAEYKQLGADKAREMYLDEAEFEVHEIETLATKAVRIAPTDEKRAKFQLIADAARGYSDALNAVAQTVEKTTAPAQSAAIFASYDEAAKHLSETAEDGELAGRDASQTSQDKIEHISKRAVPVVIGVSLAGFVIALMMSIALARAILVPVQHLKEVAENVSMGNLKITVKRFSDDEIGDLADSFSRMVTAVRFFQSEAEASQAGSVVGGEKQ
ncbi:MAG TPA: HAMP domain-containing protein [Candidatus Acidoferrum sp.]|nr:HAMP domain-containing protein [Candidatus Acidoferrum sp.]